jgi:PAS domain S-box-containing protein
MLDDKAGVDLAAPDERGWPGWREFEIAEKRPESETITSFVLRPRDGGPVAPHRPGQHLTLRLEIPGRPPLRRSYSISCVPNDRAYRISVKREPFGVASNWLHASAGIGTVLKAVSPRGIFLLDNAGNRAVVLLSAGVGLTPMMSMLETLHERFPEPQVQFVHCTTDGSTHAFGNRLQEIVASSPGFTKHLFYSRPRETDRVGRDYDRAGRIDLGWVRENTPIGEADYFICGPRAFMRTLVTGLVEAGVPRTRIHVEFFGPVEDLLDEETGTQDAAAPESAAVAPSLVGAATPVGSEIGEGDIGQALLDSAADAVIASDLEGDIIYWNPGATRIFGFEAAEALGRPLDIIIPEPFRQRHWDGYRQTVETGESRYGAGDLLAVPGQHKDGHRISLEFTIVLMKDGDGQVVGMASSLRDVSKRFEETKALRKQIAELTKKAAS